MPYRTSRDYQLLKKLLDEGKEIVCFTDFPIDNRIFRDVCKARKIGEGYIMLSDGRYLPPKEAVQQCYNAFGIRVGLGDNWEDIYDGWNKEMK